MAGLCEGGNEPPGSLKANNTTGGLGHTVNCPKTGLNLSSDTKNAPLMRQNGNSVVKTQRALRLQFNVGRHGAVPARNTILRWVQNFRLLASTYKKKPLGHVRSVRTPDKIERKLNEGDYVQRRTFAEKMVEILVNEVMFMSDKGHFHLNGYDNKQNFRYWVPENPNELHERPLHCAKSHSGLRCSTEGALENFELENRKWMKPLRYHIREGDGNVIKMITRRDEEEMAGVNLHIEMNCVTSQCRRSREDCRLLFDDKAGEDRQERRREF
ncbi:hypothetical protein ANN_01329 [Periplaneta americana]|uniref:DUF4817 domain-containing protein n=1 Tax=Periplaneta americana TaxID=6978 RepID=A0ABQ8TT93_PERAM|nr:hypothetical protein ANN_01329 [Periplaneta americana]